MFVLRSYNRPEQCKRLMKQLIATDMTEPGVIVINGFSNKDIRDEYFSIEKPGNWKEIIYVENVGCNKPLNDFFENNPNEPYYAAIDDDEWVTTPGWDKKLVAAAGNWNIANANSGIGSMERIQGLVTIGGDLVRAAGFHVLPGLFHWYGETVWEELHKLCNLRVWCESVKAEHRHWRNDKSELDATYQSQDPHIAKDEALFRKWLAQDCHTLAVKIIKDRNAHID